MKRVSVTMFVTVVAAAAVISAGEAKKDNNKAPEATYASDLGPTTVDVSNYPVALQKTYRGALQKCTKCHNLARPLNSQFLELKKREIKRLKGETPEAFEDPDVLRIEDRIWKRYVKRMMAKPGCDINPKEGKAIWEFLVFDSKERKLGSNAEKWRKHRQGLLRKFKKAHPERYKGLYGKSD